MSGALRVDAQRQAGQRISPVRVGPCWLTRICGRNRASSGGTTVWKARSQGASPVPAGSATLTAEPSAPGPPVSDGRPVNGKVAGCWCRLIVPGHMQAAGHLPPPFLAPQAAGPNGPADGLLSHWLISPAWSRSPSPARCRGLLYCRYGKSVARCSALACGRDIPREGQVSGPVSTTAPGDPAGRPIGVFPPPGQPTPSSDLAADQAKVRCRAPTGTRFSCQSLTLLLWAGHSGSGSSCHPRLVSQARSAVGWFGSCLRS
jgi:hypothetical protein